MSSLKIKLEQSEVEELGIWQAATLDGYWEDRANDDIQKVYLMGQLQASQSMHSTFGNNATRLRVKRLKQALKDLTNKRKGE